MKPNRFWMHGQRKADSKWEAKLMDGVLKHFEHHPEPIGYIVEKDYHPDFVTEIEDQHGNRKVIYVEAKGRFMDIAEASKYIWVRKALEDDEELVFLFYDPNKPMPHAKKRKDGTKRTHREWAEDNNFRWFTEYTIQEVWQ